MKTGYIILFIVTGLSLTIIGALFRIMHWPWSGNLLLSGKLVFAVLGMLVLWNVVIRPSMKKKISKPD